MTRYTVSAALLVVVAMSPLQGQERSMDTLIDFDSGSPSMWYVVNDGVMGGRSSSTMRTGEDGSAVFEGMLSLENNGGFASVRTEVPESAMAGADRLVLRVRGDGNRYQLRLRPGRRFDGVAFAASFETIADEWVTVELPIESFRPTFRGYVPRGVGPLDPAEIRQLGLMLTDKQVGEFRLELDWIAIDRSRHAGQ